MKTSEQTDAIYPALFAAISEIGNVQRNTANTFFKSKYVALDKLLEAVRPALTKEKLFILQSPSFEADTVSVETRLVHSESGQWVGVNLAAPFTIGKGSTSAQAVGSAVTYLRRYGLFSLLGVAETDDDGNGAVSQAPVQQPAQEQPKQQAAGKPSTASDWLENTVKPHMAQCGTAAQFNAEEAKIKGHLEKLSKEHPDVYGDWLKFRTDTINQLPAQQEAAE